MGEGSKAKSVWGVCFPGLGPVGRQVHEEATWGLVLTGKVRGLTTARGITLGVSGTKGSSPLVLTSTAGAA